MQKRVEGTVLLSAVVKAEGTGGDVDVEEPLGAGLDEEAVKAARAWEFDPGRRYGTPVDVLVTIELSFTLD